MQGRQVARDGEDRIGCEPESGFGPDPVPPVPPLQLGELLQTSLDAASIAVGRLDAIGTLSLDPSLFTHSHVRKGATFSAQIEGTRLLRAL